MPTKSFGFIDHRDGAKFLFDEHFHGVLEIVIGRDGQRFRGHDLAHSGSQGAFSGLRFAH